MDARKVIQQQYQNAASLNARIALHQRFSTNPQGWYAWYFDQIAFPEPCRVLELGCGPASLWKDQLDRVGSGWRMILTDFSTGMLREAKAIRDPLQRFTFATADAQALPFPTASADVVMANHMLYHVPDLDRALGEIRRVLRPGGRLYASTNSVRHMQEVYALENRLSAAAERGQFVPAALWTASFTLENGAASLQKHFTRVEIRRCPDGLRVTDGQALIDYILSMLSHTLDQVPPQRVEAMRQEIQAVIQKEGCFSITKDSGLFLAQ